MKQLLPNLLNIFKSDNTVEISDKQLRPRDFGFFQMNMYSWLVLFFIFLAATPNDAFAGCSGTTGGNNCGLSVALPASGSNYSLGANVSGVSPQCIGSLDPTQDAWYSWTAPTTGVYTYRFGNSVANANIGVAMYSGTCADLNVLTCANAGGDGELETVGPVEVTAGTTYYFQIFQDGAGNNACGTVTVTQIGVQQSITGCSGTSQDPQNASNYNNSVTRIYYYCPDNSPDTLSTLTFNSFSLYNTGSVYDDYLIIYDGYGINNPVIGSYTGTSLQGQTITSSTGCLTLFWYADAAGNAAGWNATVGCTSSNPYVFPDPTVADCQGAIGLCGTNATNVSGLGAGTHFDLTQNNDGCLVEENNTVWYFVTIEDANNDGISNNIPGTLGFTLTMPNQVDYDYAVWGPLASNDPVTMCSNLGQPSRCSYSVASGNSNTTMGIDGTTDPDQVSENAGASEDAWLYWYDDVHDGETYVIVVDRYGASDVHDYTLSFTGTAGTGGLDCSVLPSELVSFKASNVGDANLIYWSTASELNSDFFQIERSSDGTDWDIIGSVSAARNSNTLLNYQIFDYNYISPISYYRLKSYDIDGTFTTSYIVSVKVSSLTNSFSEAIPNPSNEGFFVYCSEVNSIETFINLYSSDGKIVFQKFIEDWLKDEGQYIYTGDLSIGTYYLDIIRGNIVEKKKVVVSR